MLRRRLPHIATLLAAVCFWAALCAPASAGFDVDTSGAMNWVNGAIAVGYVIFLILHLFLHLLLFWCFVWAADWVNRDAEALKLKTQQSWNMAMMLPFGFVFLPVLVGGMAFPFFCLPFLATLTAFLVPYIMYCRHHNSLVNDPEDYVWTSRAIKKWFARKFGGKVEEEEDPLESGLPIVLSALHKDKQEGQKRLILARQAPGFNDARHLICDALYRQGDGMLLDFTAEAVAIRHQIDGVWHPDDPWPREDGDEALEALKLLAGMNPEDRRGRQAGEFKLVFDKSYKYNVAISSQGTKTGERVALEFQSDQTMFETLDDIGMSPQQQETLKTHFDSPKGFILFSAMPKNGLNSTMNVALRSMDRFTREVAGVEDIQNPHEEIENILITTYDSKKGEKGDDIMTDLFLKEPQVVVCRDLVDTESVEHLLREIDNDRLIISTIRSKDAAEALLRVLAIPVTPAALAKQVTLVINQRLIRKLCDCKDAYQPNPKLLQQLGLPAGKVKALYRPHKPNPEDPEDLPCTKCDTIGYSGRTAIYEFLVVDDNVRKALATKPTMETLRAACRAAGMRTLQQEGVLMAARGVTSVEEVMRVMKQ